MADEFELSKGGANHQKPKGDDDVMTTAQGSPVAGRPELAHRRPPRGRSSSKTISPAKKSSISTMSVSPSALSMRAATACTAISSSRRRSLQYSRAVIFNEVGVRTPTFTRFSTVAGNKGSPDLARDVRGFATKFYTREGNWDLVGNNIPVFFIQDAIKFPDLIHAAKPAPDRGFPQAQTAHDNFWDFISLSPESMHMVMWIMSDRAIPRSFRFMEGFGVHTFRLVNAEGQAQFVKFHWKPKLGLQSVIWNEALKVNGARSRLPSPRHVGCDRRRRLPAITIWASRYSTTPLPRSSSSTCSMRPRSCPRNRCRWRSSAR